jgi:hypothetical protein
VRFSLARLFWVITGLGVYFGILASCRFEPFGAALVTFSFAPLFFGAIAMFLPGTVSARSRASAGTSFLGSLLVLMAVAGHWQGSWTGVWLVLFLLLVFWPPQIILLLSFLPNQRVPARIAAPGRETPIREPPRHDSEISSQP